MIIVLSGGTGGAKFVDGLRRVVPPEELTIIVNTGDDHEWWGLYVSPDIDSITYVLADKLSTERGWGVRGDTFHCLQAMKELGEPAWFSAGDRDLATHLLRTQLLSQGKSLSEATAILCGRFGVRSPVLPMSDARVETRITTAEGDISFEEYFVQRRYQDRVNAVRFAGADEAQPASGILDAIRNAAVVLVAPSNPVTSIGPILAIPGIRRALTETSAPVVAVSPIIGNASVSGPAATLMQAIGLEPSIHGVCDAYRDFLDVLIADGTDSPTVKGSSSTGPKIGCAEILMRNAEEKAAVARTALEFAQQLIPAETR